MIHFLNLDTLENAVNLKLKSKDIVKFLKKAEETKKIQSF